MNAMIDLVMNLLGSGFRNLASYLAAQVLLCLLPAILIAGAMTALIPKEIITVSIIGRRKAMTYVGLIALFSTLAGLLYGAWVDQTRPELLLLALVGILGFLALTLFCLNRRIKKSIINAGVTPVGFSNPVFREFENERKSPRPLRNICPSLHKTR